MLGFLFFLVWKVVLLIEVLEPSEHNQLRSGKQHPLFELELVLISVSYFIILASLSNVAIVWMDVAVRTQRFNIDGSTSFKPRRYVRGYQAFVSIGLLAALLISGNFGFFLAGIITLLGLAGVIAIYAIARRWFSRLLSKVSKSNSQAAQILRRIDILTNIVLVCSIMSSIGFTAFGIFNFFGIAYVCPKGAPCVQIIARDVGTTSGNVLSPSFVVYLRLELHSALIALVACQYYCRLCLGFSTVFGLIPSSGQESSAYETSRNENELQNSPQMVMRPSNQSNEHMMSPMEEML